MRMCFEPHVHPFYDDSEIEDVSRDWIRFDRLVAISNLLPAIKSWKKKRKNSLSSLFLNNEQ